MPDTTDRTTRTITLKTDYLTRVEGEGQLYIKIKGGKIADAKFKIIEPPRFFEAFMRGRKYDEAPDIAARICGICPVAYQMSAVHAMEQAVGITVGGQLRALRRLIYCGEWIESHGLHIFMLHAPDYLGYADAIHMARDHPEIVQRALQMKKAGNHIVRLLGGREIHPINVRVGGFYSVPTKRDLSVLAEQLKWGRDVALEAVKWTAQLPFPDFEPDYEFVALNHPHEYPFNEGRLVSNKGLNISPSEYDDHFIEWQEPTSTALFSRIKDRGAYLTGPMARYSLNFDKLSPLAQEAARHAGLGTVCRNPFKSIIVRSVETLYAFDEAIRLIEQYEEPDAPYVDIEPHAGTGCACTEAPRGTLYHRYSIGDDGLITDAKITPPTSQNQKSIENDLWQYVGQLIDLPDDQIKGKCEQAIRNYDPCISCSTHFLKLDIVRA
jgi:coenzyme F420-reducing hydrogenase alpha subunit